MFFDAQMVWVCLELSQLLLLLAVAVAMQLKADVARHVAVCPRIRLLALRFSQCCKLFLSVPSDTQLCAEEYSVLGLVEGFSVRLFLLNTLRKWLQTTHVSFRCITSVVVQEARRPSIELKRCALDLFVITSKLFR